MDEIFYELERFSWFRFYYRTVARKDDSGEAFMLDSVNSQRDPELFGRALETLINGVRYRVMTEIKSLNDRDSTAFLEEVLDRYLEFKKLVLEPGRTPALTVKSWGIENDLFLFRPDRISRCGTKENTANIPGSVLAQAADFARIWFEQIDEAAARARAALAATLHGMESIAILSAIQVSQDSTPETNGNRGSSAGKNPQNIAPNGKIVLNCSVGRLGLHLRLLYDEGFFPNITKTDLCKIIVKTFCTVNQPNISYRSLKNAMDAPREHAVRFFVEKWTNYLDQAETRLYMN